jgi:hypothetical protein
MMVVKVLNHMNEKDSNKIAENIINRLKQSDGIDLSPDKLMGEQTINKSKKKRERKKKQIVEEKKSETENIDNCFNISETMRPIDSYEKREIHLIFPVINKFEILKFNHMVNIIIQNFLDSLNIISGYSGPLSSTIDFNATPSITLETVDGINITLPDFREIPKYVSSSYPQKKNYLDAMLNSAKKVFKFVESKKENHPILEKKGDDLHVNTDRILIPDIAISYKITDHEGPSIEKDELLLYWFSLSMQSEEVKSRAAKIRESIKSLVSAFYEYKITFDEKYEEIENNLLNAINKIKTSNVRFFMYKRYKPCFPSWRMLVSDFNIYIHLYARNTEDPDKKKLYDIKINGDYPLYIPYQIEDDNIVCKIMKEKEYNSTFNEYMRNLSKAFEDHINFERSKLIINMFVEEYIKVFILKIHN